MIEFVSVSFGYEEDGEVIRGIDFTVSNGEAVALVGPNSVGKTTILRLIVGILRPRTGRILIDGREVGRLGARIAECLAILPQNPPRPERMSVMEVVLSGRRKGGFSFDTEEDVEAARGALKKCAIEHLARRDVTTLSGGEWQSVLVARALAQNAQNILFDEPTTHLDLSHQISVMETINRLKGEGRAILFVVHDVNIALLYSDRVLFLSNGKIIAEGRPEEVVRSDVLKEVYGVDVELIGHNGGYLVLPRRRK